ncbi:tigger transposable element-derived protein 6 [Plakobranchus ocellatus]|uniref:Tigger transposable element-derived protein 6 n=1 Tax=Plakobranchus ocellatus TaxID=259542 RepID=A0AAV3YDY5_9GAST|nr:tigger transposable element-derived protein 6 [Plakobranchus ocellatus]
MQVVKAKLQSKGGEIVEANVLFDGGSDRSFVAQDLVKKLDLKKSGEKTFSFSGFGDAESGPRTKRKVYNLELGGVNVQLAGIDTLCAEMYRAPVPRQVISKFNVEFTEDFEVGRPIKVDILIGLDYYWEVVSPERVQIDSLVAQRTRCGWMLSGSYAGKSVSKGLQMLCLNNISENVVKSLWELDAIGIVDDDASPVADKVMAKFEESTTFQRGRYEVNLSWKENQKGSLMDNKGMAEKRLHSLSRRLAGNPKLKEAYNENLSEMEKAGMIKEVSKCEKSEGPIFYLPHRPVVREDSTTTKVRPVFDASAKGYNGISLNNCLETGPNLLPNLFGLLTRFRRWKVAVTADVAKAFLHIRVHEADQNVLRFLWEHGGQVTRIMSWILRFVTRCRKKPVEHCDGDKITSAEVSQANKQLTLMTQSQHFEEEIACLKAGKHVAKSSNLYKLSPFIGEDGLLRARCRLNYSDLTFDEKFPIILPKCHFSLLIVREKHAQLKHAGVSQMITAVRNHYWVIGLRSLARKVKGECLSCKRVNARACQEPMAPLMEARLKKAPAFNTTGLDYAGPVYCKDFPGEKFYILLFTCAVTRAVHLELVNSLSLTHFLLVFRKFVSRRGLPKTVFPDNAKTFKSASTELLKLYGSNSPYWRFSVPRAPWWGGWWERMVRNMKVSLKKTVGLKSPERTELETLLTEVEACLNSRPLTFVGDDIDNGHPLTPSHFLLGRGSHLDKVSCEPSLDVSPELIKEKSKALEGRLDMFWKQWQDEYLKHLPLPKRRDKFGKLEVDSVVLIREDNCPRLQWPMGVVERLIPGKDGVARTVEVRTKRGNFFRPIQRLHGMELNKEKATEEVRKDNVYHTRFGRPSGSTVRFNIDSI